MPIQILMPALSPTMTEGNVASWLKSEGDEVAAGDILCEIETDKATMEVEATDEGTLGRIVVPAGTEGVPVNAVIGLILEEGEDASALDRVEIAAPAVAAPAAAPAEPAAEPAPAASAAPASASDNAGRGIARWQWGDAARTCAGARCAHLRKPAGAAHGQAGRPRAGGDRRHRPERAHREGGYRGGHRRRRCSACCCSSRPRPPPRRLRRRWRTPRPPTGTRRRAPCARSSPSASRRRSARSRTSI